TYADEFFGDVFGLGGKDVFCEPLLQVEIVGQPAKQRHRHVRVAVDEAGDDDLTGGIHDFARGVPLFNIAGPTDGFDASSFDRDRAVVNHASRAIHRYDGTAAYN